MLPERSYLCAIGHAVVRKGSYAEDVARRKEWEGSSLNHL
jgi:hypothetical protein